MPRNLPALGNVSLDFVSAASASLALSLTANATINTKATTWTQAIASTTVDTAWVAAQVYNHGTAAASLLVDIGVGASTSEIVLIPDLYSYLPALGCTMMGCYVFPVNIPAGTRISARCQGSVTVATVRLGIQLIAPGPAGISGLGRVEACGVVSATSSLTEVDCGAVAHTDVIAELIASTSFDYKWVNIGLTFDNNTGASSGGWLVDLMAGAGGSEVALINDIPLYSPTSSDSAMTVVSVPLAIPAGTRLSARARSSITTALDRIVDVAVWGCG